MSRTVLLIENIRATVQNGVHRVCADVDGTPVWYESADAALQAAPEVFASAFLLPAMAKGSVLNVDGRLSPVWKKNAQKLMETFQAWWGYPLIEIEAEIAEPQPECDGRTALFFTGGVIPVYEDVIQRGLPGRIERAVRALLRRSRFRLFRKSIWRRS